jgi:hypothetical protein
MLGQAPAAALPTAASRSAGDSGEASTTAWPLGEIVRDIARGGLAALIASVVVAGLGGRLVMRLAALLVPSAVGRFTENGNRIGDITLGGTAALIMFVTLFAAVLFGVVWVVISPWLPHSGVARAAVTMPMAVAFGAFSLIDRRNPDFSVLDHHPLVVASLVGLVALSGPVLVVADGWLDRRLPHPTSDTSRVFAGYIVLIAIGASIGLPLTIQGALSGPSQPLALTLIATGLMTLAWWRLRLRGEPNPPAALRLAADTALVAGTFVGFLVLAPEISGVLGSG